jgi:hypothetical protein
MDIMGIWEGTLDGTNWGRLLVKLTERDGAILGYAQIIDIGVGTYNLDVKGSRRPDAVALRLSPGRYNVREYPGTIDAKVSSETATLIRGEWRSSIGTNGTFRAEREPTVVEPPAEAIAQRIAESNAAFIIMAFSDQRLGFLPVVDIHSAIKRGCDIAGIRARRVDEFEHSGPITSLLLEQIKQHRFLISDLTHERPNVYYEVGYAHGLQKEVVLTAQKGTQVHFDIAAYNVIFYNSATELESRITKRLQARISNSESING